MNGMDPNLERVLNFLSRNRIRATYEAVGGYLGVEPQNMGLVLGPRRPIASWVVNRHTKKPTGYSEAECAPALYEKDEIITDEADLRFRMRNEGR